MLGMIVAAGSAFSLGEPELSGPSDGLPLDVEPEARTFLGVLAQKSLVSVAFIQTGREGVTAVAVEQMRQHLDDFGSGIFRAQCRRKNEKQQRQQLEPAHAVRVTAGGYRFNIELPVKYLFFSCQNETMQRSRG